MNTLLGSQPRVGAPQPMEQAGQLQTLPDIYSLLVNTFGAAQPQAAAISQEAGAALPGQLGYQAPQIDATQAFQTGVVQPTTQDFLQRALPAIAGNYGRGAGGAFGSESATARGQAGTDVARALAEQGSKFALGAAAANQQAATQAAQVRNQALGMAPGLAGITSAAVQPTLADMLTLALTPTIQPTVLGGSTGLLQTLLGGASQGAGSALGGAAGRSLFGPSTTTFAPLAFA